MLDRYNVHMLELCLGRACPAHAHTLLLLPQLAVCLVCREMQPPPPRRERLPTPKQHEKSVSLWSILKECVGKDLSRICLPVYFNEPLSVLQKTVEDLEYADLLNKVRLTLSKHHANFIYLLCHVAGHVSFCVCCPAVFAMMTCIPWLQVICRQCAAQIQVPITLCYLNLGGDGNNLHELMSPFTGDACFHDSTCLCGS